jgi:NADPH:quinone reductase-like Zn-dependent oxidoreductase
MTEHTMKAIVCRRYGPPEVLRYEDVEKPAVGDDDVLIKVYAASVNPLDWHVMRGTPYLMRIQGGFRGPTTARLGFDVAGDVHAVGRNVTAFKPGDQVFGIGKGTLAEYSCASASAVVGKPRRMTFEQAAAAPVAAFTALQGLRDYAHVQPAQKVLINGAAGGVGTFAVQVAKSFGAHVTGVCSTPNVEMVRAIGADEIVDYTKDDFAGRKREYDVLLDCVGNRSLRACLSVLTPKGTCVVVGGPAAILRALACSRFVRRKLVAQISKPNLSDLGRVSELMEAGTITPVIGKRYMLHDAAEAIRHLETGHASGKVVVTMNGEIR